jgi:hypothetical protein
MSEQSEPTPAPKRTRTGEILETGTEAANAVAKWTPQATLQVIAMSLLACMIAGFAAQLWMAQEQAKSLARENRDQIQSLIREANSREELSRVTCEQLRVTTQRGADDREARITAAFVSEGEKNRVFWIQENEKFRRELLAAIKAKSGEGP